MASCDLYHIAAFVAFPLSAPGASLAPVIAIVDVAAAE